MSTIAKLLKSCAEVPAELMNGRKFSYHLKHRHKLFWSDPNAETVRNTIMSAWDPIEKWRDVENWQRKLSNKYNSREFAKKYNCKVPQLYWRGRDVNDIDFESFPLNYVIRPTVGHSLCSVFLMQGVTNLLDSKIYLRDDIKKLLSKALSDNENLEFLIEEFVRTEEHEYRIPDDYKFYVFNGQIGCIQVINRVNGKKGYTSWYDREWNLLPNLTTNYPDGDPQAKPACFFNMMELAKKLSEVYGIFVRVDFYATDEGAVFGELTPTPARGIGFTLWAEKLLGRYWEKFCKGMV